MTLERAVVPTKSEAAYDALRRAILDNRLHPGDRVTLHGLAKDLGMSLTPVRDALRLLAADGLVIQTANRGTHIANYTPERAAEMYRLRLVLEPMAVADAARLATAEDRDLMREAQDAFARALSAGRLDQLPELNVALHRSWYSAARSTYLRDFIDRLWNGIPFDLMSVSSHPERSHREHLAITEAICAGDPRAARKAIKAHIRINTNDTLARYRTRGDG